MRDVHERIVQVYGIDFNRSMEIWEPYLEFEKGELKKLTDEKEKAKQIGRIRSIYRRRVIFPTSDMQLTWDEYKEWETD